jgi:hypothetical protein
MGTCIPHPTSYAQLNCPSSMHAPSATAEHPASNTACSQNPQNTPQGAFCTSEPTHSTYADVMCASTSHTQPKHCSACAAYVNIREHHDRAIGLKPSAAHIQATAAAAAAVWKHTTLCSNTTSSQTLFGQQNQVCASQNQLRQAANTGSRKPVDVCCLSGVVEAVRMTIRICCNTLNNMV